MSRPSLHATFSEEIEVARDFGRTVSEQQRHDDPLGRQRSASRHGRPVWQDRRSFILAAVGAAIGTGNVWRFPYLCFRYGGGSFLVPYFFALFVLGIPVMVLELSTGQLRQKGFVYTLHEIDPALAGVAWATVLNTFLSCVFYCLVMAWSVIFLLQSFSEPWAAAEMQQSTSAEPSDLSPTTFWLKAPATLYQDLCDVPLSSSQDGMTLVTFYCALEHFSLGCTPPEQQYALGLPNTTDVYASRAHELHMVPIVAEPVWGAERSAVANSSSSSPIVAETYFDTEVLRKSNSITNLGDVQGDILLSLAAVWVGVYFCIARGIWSTERVVWLTVPLPCLLMLVLLLRGATLDGAGVGLRLFATVDWGHLGNVEIWQAAATQILYSNSCALGVLPTYASFNREHQDVVKDSILIVLMNSLFSIVSGLTVFSVLGFMAVQTNRCVTDVVGNGPSLGFVVFPTALSMMPGSAVVSAIFFVMLILLGIDSAFSMAEAFSNAIVESLDGQMNHPAAWLVPIAVCVAGLLLGIPFTTQGGYYWFEWANHYIIFPLTLVACVECIGVMWFRTPKYAQSRHIGDDIANMLGRDISEKWVPMWMFVCPAICGLLFVICMVTELLGIGEDVEGMQENPKWTRFLGWWLAVGPLLFGVTYFVWGPGSGAGPGKLRPPPSTQAMTRQMTRGSTLSSETSASARP